MSPIMLFSSFEKDWSRRKLDRVLGDYHAYSSQRFFRRIPAGTVVWVVTREPESSLPMLCGRLVVASIESGPRTGVTDRRWIAKCVPTVSEWCEPFMSPEVREMAWWKRHFGAIQLHEPLASAIERRWQSTIRIALTSPMRSVEQPRPSHMSQFPGDADALTTS